MSLIIAEIGTSHEGDEKKAFSLIDAAVDSGADAVKFQWVYADEILHPLTGIVNLPTGQISLYSRFKQLECTLDFYKKMCAYAHKKGVQFICSPFGLRSLRELLEIFPDAVKIASPELNHFPMLKALAEYRKNLSDQGKPVIPVILSSGVSKLRDIESAVSVIGKDSVSLLHCITSYPAPEDEYNVSLVASLKDVFGIETGVSDHSLDPVLVPSLSTMCGGSVIEKHITLSRAAMGLDDPVALEPEQFALMVHCVHQTEAAMNRYGKVKGREIVINQLSESYGKEKVLAVIGDGIKKLAHAEEANYGRTNRSIHYMRSMKAGEYVSENDVAVLRTEKILSPGISPEFLDTVLGSFLVKDVDDGAGVKFEDFIKRAK